MQIHLVTIFLIATILVPGCAPVDNADALVVVGSAHHDFGERREGEVLSHSFTLRNQSTSALTIVGLSKSCSCVVADLSTQSAQIGPGETFDLPLQISVDGRQVVVGGEVILTYRRKGDEKKAQIRIRTSATVIADFQVDPRVVDFGQIDGLQGDVTRSITVVPNVDNGLIIDAVKSSNSFLKVTLNPVVAGQFERTIVVTLKHEAFHKSQPFVGTVIVTTSSERVRELVVKVTGEYNAPAESKPHAVIIGSDRHGQVSRIVHLESAIPSRVTGMVSSNKESLIRIRDPAANVSKSHEIELDFAREEQVVDEILTFELQLLPEQGTFIKYQVKVPVHRFIER